MKHNFFFFFFWEGTWNISEREKWVCILGLVSPIIHARLGKDTRALLGKYPSVNIGDRSTCSRLQVPGIELFCLVFSNTPKTRTRSTNHFRDKRLVNSLECCFFSFTLVHIASTFSSLLTVAMAVCVSGFDLYRGTHRYFSLFNTLFFENHANFTTWTVFHS